MKKLAWFQIALVVIAAILYFSGIGNGDPDTGWLVVLIFLGIILFYFTASLLAAVLTVSRK